MQQLEFLVGFFFGKSGSSPWEDFWKPHKTWPWGVQRMTKMRQRAGGCATLLSNILTVVSKKGDSCAAAKARRKVTDRQLLTWLVQAEPVPPGATKEDVQTLANKHKMISKEQSKHL